MAVTEVCKRIIECGAGSLITTAGGMLVIKKQTELPQDLFNSKKIREDIVF
jgi:hypothetical protein